MEHDRGPGTDDIEGEWLKKAATFMKRSIKGHLAELGGDVFTAQQISFARHYGEHLPMLFLVINHLIADTTLLDPEARSAWEQLSQNYPDLEERRDALTELQDAYEALKDQDAVFDGLVDGLDETAAIWRAIQRRPDELRRRAHVLRALSRLPRDL